MIEGVGDTDTEAYPITTSTKDASGVPPSTSPTANTTTCMDDGSGAASAYDVKDMTDQAAPAMGALDTPSFVCSPTDTAIGYASQVNVVAAPTPLTLTTGMTPVSSWCICWRRIFF